MLSSLPYHPLGSLGGEGYHGNLTDSEQEALTAMKGNFSLSPSPFLLLPQIRELSSDNLQRLYFPMSAKKLCLNIVVYQGKLLITCF